MNEQPIWFYTAISQLPPEVFEEWEERAAILTFDAGFSKQHAECLALILMYQKYGLIFGSGKTKSYKIGENTP